MDDWIYPVLLVGMLIGLVLFFVKNKKGAIDEHTYELMQKFADEMVKENQQLMETVIELNRKTDVKVSLLMTRIQELEAEVSQLQQPPPVEVPEPPPRDVLHLRNRYQEVFELFKEGKSIEEISKKLGYGKGELELILQLAGHR
ncbi:hypothetical protein [Ammoniphilus sp. YIM 78166]|uniref:DUF6115 domain-containing protein n=1 Tax=Ammoniphilus sp. YIM 78166 TaxID=1644106 RepID=UPI0010703423|nr:hypothetical protein [Ammoniphilus sp. YIM 78166]